MGRLSRFARRTLAVTVLAALLVIAAAGAWMARSGVDTSLVVSEAYRVAPGAQPPAAVETPHAPGSPSLAVEAGPHLPGRIAAEAEDGRTSVEIQVRTEQQAPFAGFELIYLSTPAGVQDSLFELHIEKRGFDMDVLREVGTTVRT